MAILLIAMVPLGTVLSGYVLTVMWSWFVVPLFKASLLSIPAGIGLSVTAKMLCSYPTQSKTEDEGVGTAFAKAAGASFLAPLIVLLMGWIVKGFL